MVSLRHDDVDQVHAVGLITRSFDAGAINKILNHADVYPLVSGNLVGPLDATALVEDHRNVLLMADGGGILFCQDEPGIYEVHSNFLPTHRGKYAIDVSKQAYRWMFLNTDCMILQTRIPSFNRPARMAARQVGFAPLFKREKAWATPHGVFDLSYYSLPYERWVISADDLEEAGQSYHDRLDEEFARHGRKPHEHPDDLAHDRYAGVCAATVYAGQPEKAIILYNRWARFAGYGQIKMTSRKPLIIDIDEAILLIGDRTFKVLKCRSPQQ